MTDQPDPSTTAAKPPGRVSDSHNWTLLGWRRARSAVGSYTRQHIIKFDEFVVARRPYHAVLIKATAGRAFSREVPGVADRVYARTRRIGRARRDLLWPGWITPRRRRRHRRLIATRRRRQTDHWRLMRWINNGTTRGLDERTLTYTRGSGHFPRTSLWNFPLSNITWT